MAKSTLPVLEVYKATAKKENPLLQGNKAQTENVTAGAKLAELGFDAASKVPSEHDANASFLQTIRKDLGEKPKGWRALAAGITEGMEFGEKRKSILDSKERLAKYQGTLKKLEDVVALSGERLATFQKGEQVKQNLTPYVSRTLDLILEGAPQERIDLAWVDLTDRYNAQTGENWKYEMGNGKGVAVVDRNTGQSAIIPWSKLTAPELQEKVIMADPVYQSQLARQQKREDAELALSERNTAANETRANASLLKSQKAAENSPEEMEKQTYLRLQQLLSEGDPTISAGTGVKQWAAQNIPFVGDMVSGNLAPQQEYQQLLADLKGLRFKKFGYRNQAEFNKIKTLDETLPKEEALKFVNNELAKLGVIPPAATAEQPPQVASAQHTVPVSQPTVNQSGDSMTMMVKVPKEAAKRIGKDVIPMTPDEAREALKNGGQIVGFQ